MSGGGSIKPGSKRRRRACLELNCTKLSARASSWRNRLCSLVPALAANQRDDKPSTWICKHCDQKGCRARNSCDDGDADRDAILAERAAGEQAGDETPSEYAKRGKEAGIHGQLSHVKLGLYPDRSRKRDSWRVFDGSSKNPMRQLIIVVRCEADRLAHSVLHPIALHERASESALVGGICCQIADSLRRRQGACSSAAEAHGGGSGSRDRRGIVR